MSANADFRRLLLNYVTVEHYQFSDEYSKPTYGEPQVYKCRIESITKQVLRPNGEVVLASAIVFFAETGAFLSVADRVTFADGSQPVIVRIDEQQDDVGPHHTEVMMA